MLTSPNFLPDQTKEYISDSDYNATQLFESTSAKAEVHPVKMLRFVIYIGNCWKSISVNEFPQHVAKFDALYKIFFFNG